MTNALLYRLTAPNGKQYIGVTRQLLAKRIRDHSRLDTVIGRAVRKYGVKMNAEILVIGLVNYIFNMEKAAIMIFQTMVPAGYNCHEGGHGGSPTEEARQKISATMTGRKMSISHRQHLSEAHRGNTADAETRQKMITAQKTRRARESLVEKQDMSQKMKQIWAGRRA